MQDIVCGLSAFRYYQTPPALRALALGHADPADDAESLMHRVLMREVLPLPLDVMMREGVQGNLERPVLVHDMGGDLPDGSIIDTGFGLGVTTPEATLLTMASQVCLESLIMAAYELCGTFCSYRPASSMKYALGGLGTVEKLCEGQDGWQALKMRDGHPAPFVMRPALTSPDEIAAYAQRAKGCKGWRVLARAAEQVAGSCATPLEARVAIALSAARSIGGQGLRKLACGEDRVTDALGGVVDADTKMVLPRAEPLGPVVLDCYPHLTDEGTFTMRPDPDRVRRLERAGCDVVSVRYGSLRDPFEYRIWVRCVLERAGVHRAPKREEYMAREEHLRQHMMQEWRSAIFTG